MICIYGLKIPYTSGFNKITKNQILIKYTEFKYGIYKNVYKPYINCIISIYIFLIGHIKMFFYVRKNSNKENGENIEI